MPLICVENMVLNLCVESGHGPVWMAPPYVTPFKKWLEKLVHTRLLTWMSPCIWGSADGFPGIRNLLHGTVIGRFLVDRFWGILGGDVISLNKYDAHKNTAKLKPWTEAFFTGCTFSILNYPTNFFELVKGDKVNIHIADITSLSPGKVHLSSGEVLSTDALLCATGWKRTTPLKFLPQGLETQLGIPTAQSSEPQDTLVACVDAEITSTYPRLRYQPAQNKLLKPLTNHDPADPNEAELSPFNLYRFMVPADEELIETHDIAFAGYLMNFMTSTMAQTQALWIAAYFDGAISPLSPHASSTHPPTATATTQQRQFKDIASLQYATLLHNRFGRWRYPSGWSGKLPDFVFDALPYVDLLLGDLGLETHRKGSTFREVTEPYGPEDYVGVVQEWLASQKKTR